MVNEIRPTDKKCLDAYAQGKADGLKAGRQEGVEIGKKLGIIHCTAMISRELKIAPEELLAILQIPRKERKGYLGAIYNRMR